MPQRREAVETGPDAVWCGAAHEWLAARGERHRPPCAVVPVPLEHANTRSLDASNTQHYASGFKLLRNAGIRATPNTCWDGRGCWTHPWARKYYFGTPNWALPTDVPGMWQVRACAATRMDRAICHSLPRDPGGAGPQYKPARLTEAPPPSYANDTCDHLTQLYWRSHHF